MENKPPLINQPPQMPKGGDVNLYVSDPPPHLPAYHPVADANGVTQDDRTMAMLIHLLGLLTGFLGPLILWLVKKDQSKFIDFHGREALNFMITVFIYYIAFFALTFVIVLATYGIGMFIIIPFAMILGIGQIVFEIMACVAANKGEWHRYPMTIRLIPSVN